MRNVTVIVGLAALTLYHAALSAAPLSQVYPCETFNADLNGWTNYCTAAAVGGWRHDPVIQCAAHDAVEGTVMNWLVSPAINLDVSGADRLCLSFLAGCVADMTNVEGVYISTGERNPSHGGYIQAADIGFQPCTWIQNQIDISAYLGNSTAYLAFAYLGGNPWQIIDNVCVTGETTGIDNAVLASPATITISSYQATPTVQGRLYIAGETGPSGPAADITAQFGYGMTGALAGATWTWVAASYVGATGDFDVFETSATVTVAGVFDYAYRFRKGGDAWVYGDLDGSTNGCSSDQAGEMTVNMLPPQGSTLYAQTLADQVSDVLLSGSYPSNAPPSQLISADDFTMCIDADLSSVRWKGLYYGTGRTGAEQGFLIQFYANEPSNGVVAFDHPGAVLYFERHAGYACESWTGLDAGWWADTYLYHVDLAAPFRAEAGSTYWFSVQLESSEDVGAWGNWAVISTPDPVSRNLALTTFSNDWAVWTGLDMGFEFYGAYANYGVLTGHVSRACDGAPVENALVSASDGAGSWGSPTETNGNYQITLPLGTYDVTATALDYQTGQVSGVTLSASGETVPQNFSLAGSALGYTPTSIEVTAKFGKVVTNTVVITNSGPLDVDYFVSIGSATASTSRTVSELDVVVCGAHDAAVLADIQTKLLQSGKFNSVGVINVQDATPSLAALQAFDAVLVFLDHTYNDETTLGNVMADYADSGGGVVCMMLEIGTPNASIWTPMGGNWVSHGYVLVNDREGNVQGQASLGVVHIPSHPVMAGVTTFDGGANGFQPTTSVKPDGTLVADWSNGRPLVAVKNFGHARRADLYFSPLSSDVRVGGWDPSTDGARLMANALCWVADTTPSWATVSTNAGTVVAEGISSIDVILNAGAISNSGAHTASLSFSGGFINDVPDMPLTIHVVSNPIIHASATTDFGVVEVSITSSVPLVVRNVGLGVLTGELQNIAPPFGVDGPTTYHIPSFSNVTLDTFFVSDNEGDFSGVVTLTGGDGAAVTLIGIATPEPGLLCFAGVVAALLVFIRKRALKGVERSCSSASS